MVPQYRVYVIQNSERRFYIGVTADVTQRLAQHNAGDSKWTKGKGPWQVIMEKRTAIAERRTQIRESS